MGRFTLYVNDELHKIFSELSHMQGFSMNNLINRFILYFVCGHPHFYDVFDPEIYKRYITYYKFKTTGYKGGKYEK